VNWRQLAFCRELVDRAAHRRTDDAWLAEAWLRARVLVVAEDGRVLVTGGREAPKLVLVSSADAPDGERLFLGEDGEAPYFAVVGPHPAVPGARAADIRQVGAELDGYDAGLLAEAVGLVNWRQSYQFSPLTGAPLELQSAGWEAVATDGSGIIWPRTNPAIIVLVNDGVAGDAGRCLLTRQPGWPAGRYSCLAGFVEPGESAEAAVHREAYEETGVEVSDVTYYASQPWPLPASLMLGFYAYGDPSRPVRVDTTELEDARWFTRGELRGKGPSPSPLGPSPISISYHLIARWRDEIAG
jgi:NAD+ diphosphatase